MVDLLMEVVEIMLVLLDYFMQGEAKSLCLVQKVQFDIYASFCAIAYHL